MVSSSNPSLLNFKYDVFVSYVYEDTGKNFTSHLKAAFAKEGFNVAMNDMIDKGKEISDTLLSQISESRVSVVVFSKSYASCPDCLDELVKIMEREEENGGHVLPVFLGVVPSDVRKQTGVFGDSFHGLIIQNEQFKNKKEIWASALMKTANLSGWDSAAVKSEAKIVKCIIERIMKILDGLPSRNFSYGFVGNYQVEKVKSMLQLQFKTNVQFLGIWGMGGIGKTTISKEVFLQLSSLFDASCYLENVTQTLEREGLQSLTKKMFLQLGEDWKPAKYHSAQRALNNKRVLIILDDVSNFPGLKSLVNLSYDPGSRVILTCRDKQVLKSYKCEHLYKVEELGACESHKLFEFHAFKEQTCQEMDKRLLNKALSYCGGLPLALEILGCNLCDKNFEEWESELAKLENLPNRAVNKVIRSSYEGLEENEKEIFLDIACVFHGWDEDGVKRILDECGLYAGSGISHLLDKALITNWQGKLRMHDLIQQCGHDIVFQECKEEPGNRSRLWRFENFAHVVQQNTGSEKVECISVDLSKATIDMYMMPEFFDKMPRLRVLDLRHVVSHVDYFGGIKLHLPKGLRSLSNKLRYLRWDCYPLTSFPEKFTLANHLVKLLLRDSKVKQLWSEGAELPHLPMLESMDLSCSKDLIKLPDSSKTPNLKTLVAFGCGSLIEIPSSIQHLSKLQSLQMGYCVNFSKLPELPQSIVFLNLEKTKIEELPSSITYLSQLQTLRLSRCKNLKSLSDLPSSLKELAVDGCTSLKIEGDYIFGSSLKTIYLYETEMESLPVSIKHLSQLQKLYLSDSKNLKSLPDLPSSLKELYADGCTSLKIVGDFIFGSSLIHINLCGTDLESLSVSIKHLSQLQKLELRDCKNLKSLPDLPSSLEFLYADGCTSLKIEGDYIFGSSLKQIHLSGTDLESLPVSIKHLSQLQKLELRDCKNLKSLLDLPSSLEFLYADGCTSLKIEGDYIFGSSLKQIHLCGTELESLPASIKHLSQLQKLELRDCKNLKSLPDLPSSLEFLYADGCTSLKIEGDYIFGSSLKQIHLCGTELESLPASIKHLSQLQKLELRDCKNLKSLPDLPSSLEFLYADGCTSLKIEGDYIFGSSLKQIHLSGTDLESLPVSIKHLSQLQKLELRDCKNLKSLLDLPSSLEFLYADGCTSLKIEGDYIFGSSLKQIHLSGTDLESLPVSIKHLSQLQKLELRDCKNLKSLLDLPSSLEFLYVDGCTSLKIVGDFIFGSSLIHINLCGTELESLPASIKHLSQLQNLELRDCKNLKSLPVLPSSLKFLYADGCTSLKIVGDYIFGSSLIHINLCGTELESLPASIKHLSQLQNLYLRDCKNLKSLPDLPSSLEELEADGCTSLKIVGDFTFGSSLKEIYLCGTELESLPASIKHLSQLHLLELRDCKNLKSLPDLPSSLEYLDAAKCTSLKIEGDYIFGSSLIHIDLSETDLESLPASIKHLSQLQKLYLSDCKNLKSLPDLPSSLQVLDAKGCTSLTTVGNFFGEDHCERHLQFNLGDCFNLDQNSWIRSLLSAPPRLRRMELCIPGSEVPDWFKYKEDGSSINLKMIGGTLSDLSKLAFCIVIEGFSKKIPSVSRYFLAECNCRFVTESGEQRGGSSMSFWFDDLDIKSEHVFLWIWPDIGYDKGILSSPLEPAVRFSEAKFEFRAHFESFNDDKKMECKIIQCGVSQIGGVVWETHKREIRQREYEEEEEEPTPKRFKCDQPLVTPSYN